MARVSAAGAPATPDQTEESEERSSTGAGAMATSNTSIDARQLDNVSPGIMLSNTTYTGAMGQNESREAVKARNDAIRRAGKQAVVPRPGKLPSRRSGTLSRVASGQRRLGTNVLADANTYDVPSDDEPAPSRRQAATKAQFSPLKHQIFQQSQEERRRREERERQAALDQQLDSAWQRESEQVVEDIENRRESSKVSLSHGNGTYEESGSSASIVQPNADAEEPELATIALVQTSAQSAQQSNTTKKRGRPRKLRRNDEEQGRTSDGPLRKRGRPSYAQKEAEARELAARQAAEATDNREGPTGMTDELDGPTSSPQIATAQNQRLSRSTRTADTRSNIAPRASDSRRRQVSASQGVAQEGSSSRHRAAVTNEDEPLFVEASDDTERPDFVRPAELGDVDEEEHNDQTPSENGQPVGEEDGDGRGSTDYEESSDDDDDHEHVDETEIQLDAMPYDRHRLYGQWHKIREVMHEATKHKGSTVRIKDDEFKEVLQACKETTMTVNIVAADINPARLTKTVDQCRNAITQARSICGNGDALPESKQTRKRGFHIFKHLLPTLARLLRAAIKAFERVDAVDVDTDQISLDHLAKILELLVGIVECGESAYKSYKALSKTIKKDVHKGITIHLRELYSSLSVRYNAEVRRRDDQQRNEEIARELAARDEERERQAQRRQLELHNQDKWKSMNRVRLAMSMNSGNIKKQHHLRSCGMQLVQTDADGQPYLPTHLREKRGDWSMREIEALEASLKRHVDTPAPLRSMVFEKLITEQCPFRMPLTDKNVLEIVIKSNELKNFYIQRSRDDETPLAEWVSLIPRWMDPPRSGDDSGSSAEDAIEIE